MAQRFFSRLPPNECDGKQVGRDLLRFSACRRPMLLTPWGLAGFEVKLTLTDDKKMNMHDEYYTRSHLLPR